MRDLTHEVDVCVVGGGLAGLSAAVAAARRGAKVVLMQDRPVLGGNASSEIRMWICGAHGENMRETGIVEEIRLENAWRNPEVNFAIWDSVLYGLAIGQPNLTLLLNCSCNAAEMDGERIRSIRGWQLTSETWHTVEAEIFADCSGDGILAPLTGAEFRMGREARAEFGEDIEPKTADDKTMGMSCLMQGRNMGRPTPFTPPAWAYTYPQEDAFAHRNHDVADRCTNFWWLEIGGEGDTVHDAETNRDELLKIAFGVWDHIKNHGDHGAENWALEWIGFLPGKREARRFVGDHILTENDVRAEGRFGDLIAYGGWSMDDHHPAGFGHPGEPTIFHRAPSPYGIPYRCLYHRDVPNLMFAGRNISVTHAAMSSTRVMGTCATLGQAVGTAAAIAIRNRTTPRGVYENHLDELQQALQADDCYLPWHSRRAPEPCASATLTASTGDPEPVRNGVDRPVGENFNGWQGDIGGNLTYEFDAPRALGTARIVFDSDLTQEGAMRMGCHYPAIKNLTVPERLVRAFRVETRDADGKWSVAAETADNYQRLVRVPLSMEATGVRLVVTETWGAETANVMAFDVEPE